MTPTVELISQNIKRFRERKKLSQKEVSISANIPQGQYSRIENGKVEPSISTLEKLAKVLEVGLYEFFQTNDPEQIVNLALIDKIKLIDQLDQDEQQALLKIIDVTLSNKRMKDNLQNIISGK